MVEYHRLRTLKHSRLHARKPSVKSPNEAIPPPVSQNPEDMTCELCNTKSIKLLKEGYTCTNCGFVVESQHYEYYKPYNDEVLQNSVAYGTKMGTIKERTCTHNSTQLRRLSKLDAIRDNKKVIEDQANMEITRIFAALGMDDSTKHAVFTTFKKLRARLGKGTKYRAPDKLIPISIYYTLKMQGIIVDELKLLEVSNISKKAFNHFKLSIHSFFPKYAARKREEFVLKKLMLITEEYDMGMPFFHQCKRTLYRLWDDINNTKEDVIAGVVAGITILCSYQDRLSVNAVCKLLNIQMSTIQAQVRRKVFGDVEDKLSVRGLVKLAPFLRKLMRRLGVLELSPEEVAMIEEVEEEKRDESIVLEEQEERASEIVPDIIQLTASEVIQVRPRSLVEDGPEQEPLLPRNTDVALAFRTLDGGMNLVMVRIPAKRTNRLSERSKRLEEEELLVSVEAIKVQNGKGPPLRFAG